MARFFFNLTSHGELSVDEAGTEFPSLEEAYLETCHAALDIAIEKLRARQDPAEDSFEIVDEQRNLLMQVPFCEVLRPASTTSISTVRQARSQALDDCRHQIERSKKLKADICAELEQAEKTFGDIRANLARFGSHWPGLPVLAA